MASLRPNIDVSPNAQGAATAYTQASKMFLDALDKPFDNLNKYVTDMEKQKLLDEERAIRNEKLGWEREQKVRDAEKYNRDLAKEIATNEGLKAIIDPKAYQNEKLQAEQRAIQESLAALSPEERVVAEQALAKEYRPEVSGQQWLNLALGNENVDQSKLLSTKKSVYDIAASTPGTPEYEAKVAADRAEKKWAIDLLTAKQKEVARYADELEEQKNADKVAGIMKVLNVEPTKQVEEVVNQGQIKNIEDKQMKFGTAYVEEIEKKRPTIDALTSKIAEAEKRLETAPENAKKGLQVEIERNKQALTGLEDLAKRVALGKSGMGAEIKELPMPRTELFDKAKTKEEFTQDIMASLGPNPSIEAVTLAGQEIAKRYPTVDKSVKGWNDLAKQYGGSPVSTNDPKVAEANAKAAIDLKKALANKKASEFGSVNKTTKTLEEIFDKYGSPDVIGSGNEVDITNKIYEIKAKYGLKDDQMEDVLLQSTPSYRDELFGVDEDLYLRTIEEKAKAYKGIKQ